MSQVWREKRKNNNNNTNENQQHKKSQSYSNINYRSRSNPKNQFRSYDDHRDDDRDERDERDSNKRTKRENPEVLAVKKATGGYFQTAEIIASLKSLEWNVDESIRTLNEKRKNSWSNVVNPVTSPQVPVNTTAQNNSQAENTNKKKKTKTKKRQNDKFSFKPTKW